MLVSKVNDQCQGFCIVCECYMTGQILTGASTVIVNGVPVSILNSIVQGSCGHIGTLITTSKNIAQSLPIGRLGDSFQGIFTGSVITGSNNVISN
jgi:uncharacterized Zn-binding protein involved in type VI secretion